MMKWACKNTLGVYNYSIDIENILSPVYHLILDLVKENYSGKEFYEWIGTIFDFKMITGRTHLDEDHTEDSFLIEISNYLENYLYEKSALLERSGILLLYRTNHILIASKEIKKQVLILWIKNSGLINRFFDLINNSCVNIIKGTLTKFFNDQYFGNYIKIKELSDLKGTFIPKNYLEGFREVPIDEKSIWICEKWKNQIGTQENSQYNEVFIDGIEGCCLSIDNWILPTEYIDKAVTLQAAVEYFWAMLNYVYARKVNKRIIYQEKCKKFSEALKEPEFANLLKGLQYNLYIPKSSNEIPEKYKVFFEEVYNIEQFKEEANQLLFTGNHLTEQVENKQTMFGLYKTVKDDTEFNLRAWINVETNNSQKITTSAGVEDVVIQTVYALKPYYSYYFCKDYFEDMFLNILKECRIQAISNFELYKSDDPNHCFIEIDNLVKKEDKTLVYIENKTTLSKLNIEDTLKEIVNFHQIMSMNYPNVKIEYLLVSLYYDETVEEGFSYFTNIDGNSVTDFKIPIARYKNVDLHCIIEPEYTKLKSIIGRLLR